MNEVATPLLRPVAQVGLFSIFFIAVGLMVNRASPPQKRFSEDILPIFSVNVIAVVVLLRIAVINGFIVAREVRGGFRDWVLKNK